MKKNKTKQNKTKTKTKKKVFILNVREFLPAVFKCPETTAGIN